LFNAGIAGIGIMDLELNEEDDGWERLNSKWRGLELTQPIKHVEVCFCGLFLSDSSVSFLRIRINGFYYPPF
jgi:hypothetical protein